METEARLNQPAPEFKLFDTGGTPHTPSTYRGLIVILNFWSSECPWVEADDRRLIPMIKEWGDRVILLSIASNANEEAKFLSNVAISRGIPVVLIDADHQIADLYGTETTPQFFVIDTRGILRYQGAFDDMNFQRRNPTHCYVAQAIETLDAGNIPDPASTPPRGCAILRYQPDYSTG